MGWLRHTIKNRSSPLLLENSWINEPSFILNLFPYDVDIEFDDDQSDFTKQILPQHIHAVEAMKILIAPEEFLEPKLCWIEP